MSVRFETVIGLEVHAQLLTESKIFCGCSTKFGLPPNSQTCPVCTGMPGSLPVLNKKALMFTIKTGLAMNCSISPFSRFARKNYFYPDLPKGYQISQYELPVCEHGQVEINAGEGARRIGITRIHIEEDAGKNIHEGAGPYSFVDLNRAGTPLMEIVSEPEIRSPKEASAYMRKLRAILRYIGVCDGNMEQGSLRCDANVSIRPEGSTKLGTKVELKNMNSFKFVEKALEYEVKRQISAVKNGEAIIQETRLWDSATGKTISMRSKEEAHDYRYFPEPDLVPFMPAREWIEEIKAGIPELPDARRERFIAAHGLPGYDAEMLTSERALAEWFEEAVKLGAQPKAASNWIMGELMRLLNEDGSSIEESPLAPAGLVELLKLIDSGTISGKIAKTVFEEMYKSKKSAAQIIKEKGLVQISGADELGSVIDQIISSNSGEVERFRAGEEKLFGFFVGQAMKATKGKGNPAMINELLRKKLSEK
ncbi:MAG: Asp-tRNA(Asn)/Glu-tRNA(Gln) amidotransferase subunit GatB [Nitrospiraceae bacterium]|nr:Asp-tRNA(Asn)/Glu-tRNA(Gln) amidotransferase subunit GatB [Nitrospiraceae bacterium]MDA8089647.1 Asp-tRNA(Asn)/Glu-tRNA(Gln) amidotransferase subunit GatB [Nitrospiraceae bacterium]